MNLYDQLQALQVIPDAHWKWKSYREDITRYIVETSYGHREIAIFGAGSCNDIDLKLLTAYFEKVYLLDKDEKAMKDALLKYGLAEHVGIEIKVIDFTGLCDEDYRHYADALISEVRKYGKATRIEDLVKVALNYLNQFRVKIVSASLDFGSYDNTVVVGVHSQLISMLEWIWTVILQTLGKEEMQVRQQIIALNNLCVKKFNDAVFTATQYHSIIGCEVKRVGQVGSIQGAIQSLEDINLRKLTIINSMQIIWPFNELEDKRYEMQFNTIKK